MKGAGSDAQHIKGNWCWMIDPQKEQAFYRWTKKGSQPGHLYKILILYSHRLLYINLTSSGSGTQNYIDYSYCYKSVTIKNT